jgi:hypothetical protein
MIWHWCVLSVTIFWCVREQVSSLGTLADLSYALCVSFGIGVAMEVGHDILEQVSAVDDQPTSLQSI